MNIDRLQELTADLSSPASLPSRWRALAEQLCAYGAEAQAAVLSKCAEELEQAWREWELEALTIEEAAKEGGYSYSHLQHLVADGKIENVGGEGSPRIRRSDVPKKALRRTPLARSKADVVDVTLARHRSGGEP